MQRKKIFVSFDFDNDKILKNFIIGQTKLPSSPFSAVDISLREAEPELEWEAEAERRISQADLVIIMVGDYTHKAQGVLKEVSFANKHRTKIFQVIGYKDGNPTPVPNAGPLNTWNWDNLKKVLS